MKKLLKRLIPLVVAGAAALAGYLRLTGAPAAVSLDALPPFDGSAAVVILDDNRPDFAPEDLTAVSYETYSPLDALGRCGAAEACVGLDLMPTEERGAIGSVKPSGWQTVKYDFVDGKYLYNRCHLIGYQLTGENANEENLITGTRYLNVEGMLPYENQIAEYVQSTGNHVLYRVTPVFEGTELVARGVRMEAMSVEDDGAGVCFDVYAYNSQPGVEIDYATGVSQAAGGPALPQEEDPPAGPEGNSGAVSGGDAGNPANTPEETAYVLNTSSKKFHEPDCSGAAGISPDNRRDYTGSRTDLIAQGYDPCGQCAP